MLNHNGLDVETQEEVDKAYETVIEQRNNGACTRSASRFCSTAPTAFSFGTETTTAGKF